MANRYWVGGTGTWNTTSTTNWSAASGGASGASVPTTADAVFFDQSSNYNVTMTGALACQSLTVSAGSPNFLTGTTPTLTIAGGMSLIAGTVWTSTATITFTATGTISTNGVTIAGAIVFNGAAQTWTLGSALSTSSSITLTRGTLLTSNFAVTCANFVGTGGGGTPRALTLGTSTVSITGNAGWSVSSGGFTFSGASSTINLSGASPQFLGGGLIYGTVSFTGTTAGSINIAGINTYTNLSVTPPAAINIKSALIQDNQTITGTLTVSGASAVRRIFITSNNLYTTRTLTVNAFSASPTDIDFRDITIAGAAAGTSITRGGDCLGNTGITFPASKTVYWNLAGAQNWSATGWAATSGGAPAVTNFPLAQDIAVFDNTGSVTGTITIERDWNIGSVNSAARSSAMTLTNAANLPFIYGSWTNGTGITVAGTGTLTFAGRIGQDIISSGKTFPQPIVVSNYNPTFPNQTILFRLLDAFATSSSFTLLEGVVNFNGFTLTSPTFTATTTTYARLLSFSGGSLVLTGSGSAYNISSINSSTSGTGTISLTSASAKTFVGGSVNYAGVTLNNGGAGALTVSGSNTFANITNTVQPTTFTFTSGTTTTASNFSVNGTAGNLVTINSTTPGVQATLSKSTGTVNSSYLNIQDSNATGGATWYALLTNGNVNSGNNTGWLFGTSVTVSVTGVSATGYVGTVTVTGTANVSLTGVSATGYVGTVNVVVTSSWQPIVPVVPGNWVPVDDSQTGAWTPVSTAQTAGWVPVNDSQTGTWTPISPSQTPAWVDVNTQP